MVYQWNLYNKFTGFIETVYMTQAEFVEYVKDYRYVTHYTCEPAGSIWQK